MKKNITLLGAFLMLCIHGATAQTNINGSGVGAIRTGASFLTISPDSRSGAMGEAGAAISPDANAAFWNPSKLAFLEETNNFSVSYSPWLRQIVPDINLAYLSYARVLDSKNTIGLSFRYFDMGSIGLKDDFGTDNGTFSPNEFSIDATFARKFGDEMSLGLTLRYINSSLSGAVSTSNGTVDPGRAANAFAADVSMFYQNKMQQFGKDAILAFGLNISNIGSKLSYENGTASFIPANLKIGAANTWFIDADNSLTLALDINKLLVPLSTSVENANTISVPTGIFKSFSDAPGGFKEELKELTYSTGLEYSFKNRFALRGGYFFENPDKGDRQFFTVGAGVKYSSLKLDFAYLIATQDKNALSNTLRFSLGFDFGAKK